METIETTVCFRESVITFTAIFGLNEGKIYPVRAKNALLHLDFILASSHFSYVLKLTF